MTDRPATPDELLAALKPFADAVYNDNGDMTVNHAPFDDYVKAYFVVRRTKRATPSPEPREQPVRYPVILGGDHAQFEIDHANTPPKERPDWPLPSFDAKDWAKAFCRRFIITHRAGYDTKAVDDDEGLMLTWFANALMRGFDEHAARSAAEPEPYVEDDRPIPTYGQIPWRQLGRDVNDAIYARRNDFKFGAASYPGHEMVPSINFNSLARIVDKYRRPQPDPRDALEMLAAIMMENGLATGHGDTIFDLLTELKGHLPEFVGRVAARDALIAQMREALEDEISYFENAYGNAMGMSGNFVARRFRTILKLAAALSPQSGSDDQ